MKPVIITLIVLLFACTAQGAGADPSTCTYDVSIWNVRSKGIAGTTTVRHDYASLSEDEVDPLTGCTVCSEDQERLELPGVAPFSVCRKIAPEVRATLMKLLDAGEPVLTVRGYLVIRSRGPVDEKGNRTKLSNHSYGAAIDINRNLNGLYTNCVSFGPQCRLMLGGAWRPGVAGTLEADGAIVRAMKELGFSWGGEIKGIQKDFMHFSRSGY